MPPQRHIHIENARTHNLRGFDCAIPLRQLTAVTGVSGSGKSSLAFDTLYAEGQRRYVASLSTYARQFLERMARPAVDAMGNVPPAIAIEQRNRTTNARSTVGTATEIVDLLRLLFAKSGETHCPDCRRPVEASTPETVALRLFGTGTGQKYTIAAPLPAARRESATALRERLLRDGYPRVLDADGMVADLGELSPRAFAARRDGAMLVLDRLELRPSESRGRLVEAIAAGFQRGDGEVVALPVRGEPERFREGFRCDGCGRAFAAPEPALFSFSSPLGACARCQGFGRVPALDWERLVPDAEKSLKEGAIVPFTTPTGDIVQRDLLAACRRLRIPTTRPWKQLTAAQRELISEGDGADWYGVRGFFQWLERRRYKVQARVLIARYRRFDPCPDCGGARLRPEALCVEVGGTHFATLCRMTIAAFGRWLEELALVGERRERAARILEALRSRVHTALRVGLDYLSLDRQVRTLSGGEAQRIQLARALGGALTATLYVLDEPSVGLHPRDVARLLAVLRAIRDQGNTVVVVEHAPEIIRAADYIIDLGPGAGREGGSLIAAGNLKTVCRSPRSLTGRVLRGDFGVRRRRPASSRSGRAPGAEVLRVIGARANNLQNLSLEIPLRRLVCITGVSGAGKSSLVRSVIVGHLNGDPERGPCDRIEGGEALDGVVVVEATPPLRSPRSNPATLSKAFDAIRKAFAATREARAAGLKPSWFSFNVAGGRCEACEGAGEVVVDMQFLDDVRVPCEACAGTRYQSEQRRYRLRGRTIVEILAMTLDEASAHFASDATVAGRLAPYLRAGLGYLTLGQPIATLSGGELQRLRIATALGGGAQRSLYVFDEPTTGLHPVDIEVLLSCLDELIDAGGSVLIVEHNLDVIRHADWILDLGPEGGPGGGRLVASGRPERVAQVAASHTGAALRGIPR